jgi:hypothetical protein
MDKTPADLCHPGKPVRAGPAIHYVDGVCRGISHATFWPARKAIIAP